MRIWSKILITSGALPTKQLKSMRYELGDMIKQYPNIKHPLVKFANNYDIAYLGQYFAIVCMEFDKRKINHNITYDSKIFLAIDEKTKMSYQDIMDNNLVFREDDTDYLKICKWNLYEKFIRGMITKDEWVKIVQVCKEEGII